MKNAFVFLYLKILFLRICVLLYKQPALFPGQNSYRIPCTDNLRVCLFMKAIATMQWK